MTISLANIVFQGIELFVLFYFGTASLYMFIFSFAGRFYKPVRTKKGKGFKKIAVFIPGYKEDGVIVNSVKSALAQNYPMNLFDVIVIADSFKEETIDTLKKMPILLVHVNFEKRTKAKALNRAMKAVDEKYDLALVLDADNIMEPDFLQKVAGAFGSGISVLQVCRSAKNLNTPLAILDGISEEINNQIFRKGHRALGVSSGLCGSGMVFEYQYFKKLMSTIDAVGGFDKELEFEIFKNGETIEYLHDVIVYDEKTQHSTDFKKQRRRWLSTQGVYFKKYVKQGFEELFYRRNIDFFDKLYQMIVPPRILLLGGVFFIALAYLSIDIFFDDLEPVVASFYWYAILMMLVTAYAIAIPGKYVNLKTCRAVLSVPKVFWIMLLLLFKLRGANKTFIHTTHKSTLK